MSSIRRLPGGNKELKKPLSTGLRHERLRLVHGCPIGEALLLDKQAPGCLLHACARPRSQQANETCLKHCDG